MTQDAISPIVQPAPVLPWAEEDTYAVFHAVVVDAVLSPLDGAGWTDPHLWQLLTQYMSADEATTQRLLRHYRWGKDLLDDVLLVLSTPFTSYDQQVHTEFSTRQDLVSPVVVVKCTPSSAAPTFAYAALVWRPVQDGPAGPSAADIPYIAASEDARRATGQQHSIATQDDEQDDDQHTLITG